MLVAASNPCPCGLGGDECGCAPGDKGRYLRRLSGPLLDRIDITLSVPRPSAQGLRSAPCPPSSEVRARVVAARERQERRFAGTPISCNAQMTPRMVRELAGVTDDALRPLYAAHDAQRLSARGHHRVLRVARTIADLEAAEQVLPSHIATALAWRTDSAAKELMAA
jgi:magnesium chelatase family protein